MNFSYGRSAGLLIVVILLFLVMGPLIAFVVVALLVLMKSIQWINEYKKNQKDYETDLQYQLEILKYKNKQKGENYDNQS
ncbi:MAG: hypothetical protein FWE95_10565 [Planctomycetaceae bacterium]|nr:hypothetical protein [Planctomycetaceae bacterium]